MTNTIKILKNSNQIKLNNITYQGYFIGNLPPSFGFKQIHLGKNEDGIDKYKYGKSHWFKFKGLTYIEKTDLPF